MASAALNLPSPARDMLANSIAREGPAWRNLADNVRAGGTPNQFVRFAVAAIEDALRTPRGDDQ